MPAYRDAGTTIMSVLMPTEKLCHLIASPSPLPHRKVGKPPLPPLSAMALPPVPLVAPDEGPSVFQVLNIFRHCWFLNRDHLIANILSTQKDESDRIFWVDFQSAFHTHLVQWALTLLPPLCLVAKGKQCMFMFILEILTVEESGPEGSRPFFELLKKKGQTRLKKARVPSKALVPPKATSHPPSPSPSLPTALLQVILRMPTTRDTPLPPVTLSQVEDTLTTSEMVQALHKPPPPPTPSPPFPPVVLTWATP